MISLSQIWQDFFSVKPVAHDEGIELPVWILAVYFFWTIIPWCIILTSILTVAWKSQTLKFAFAARTKWINL